METEHAKIIIVDDNVLNLTLTRNLLKRKYTVYPAPSAAKLFEILEKVIPDLILLDIEMPKVNGYEVIQQLKADARYMQIPVIFLTAKSDEKSEMMGFALGATEYIHKPFTAPILLQRIANQLLLSQQKAELQHYAENLESMVHKKTHQILDLQNSVLYTVADLVEFRDRYTGGHISRTQSYLKILTTEMLRERVYMDEILKWDLDFFLPSGQLHDVGKIAITDTILNKPGKLTPEEFEIMKTHVSEGVKAIKQIMENAEDHAFLHHALLIAGTHHEKWDGSGYPNGLKGHEIPLEGRLMAIADVYDALISERPYKKPFSHEEACRIILDGSGTHFDPKLVEVFKHVAAQFDQAAKEVAAQETNHLG